MTHPNKRSGNSYETRFLENRIKQGATKTLRHYGSIGITDVEWTDKNGQKHEAQLKFSRIRMPKLATKYYPRLRQYARARPTIKVWLICKLSRKPELWQLIT